MDLEFNDVIRTYDAIIIVFGKQTGVVKPGNDVS